MSNACPMIVRCYYHQHPEDYGRPPGEDGVVPASLRYGSGEAPVASTSAIPEEIMGNLEARALG
jgi:hypothetical protein